MIYRLKSKINQIHIFFHRISIIKLIFIGVSLSFLFSMSCHYASKFFLNQNLNAGFSKIGTIYEEFGLVVIFIPIFETLLYQYGIIETLKKKINDYFTVFISALIFGLSHMYNLFYFTFAFFGGIMFAYFYLISKTTKKGITIVLSIHIIYNFLVLILKHTFH